LVLIFLTSCGKNEEQIKKELSARVFGYESSLYKAYDPNNKKDELISEIKSFLKPGIIGETRAENYYNERQRFRNNWDSLKSNGFEFKIEISKIVFNEKKDEAKVNYLVVEKGINCRGIIGKDLKSIQTINSSVFVLINGVWYRDVEKVVKSTCE